MDELIGKLGLPGTVAAIIWAVYGGWQLRDKIIESRKERNGNGTGNGHSLSNAIDGVKQAVDELGHVIERELDELRKGVDADHREALESHAARVALDAERRENDRLRAARRDRA
jgi:hypothetical protein